MGNLPIGKQQLVEIAKALSCNARVLIMDEPTSSLSQTETETLFEVVHDLRRQGISIIYISHRLGEVKNWPIASLCFVMAKTPETWLRMKLVMTPWFG